MIEIIKVLLAAIDNYLSNVCMLKEILLMLAIYKLNFQSISFKLTVNNMHCVKLNNFEYFSYCTNDYI